MTIVEQSVAVGLIVAFLVGELFGVTPGMVVPGYVSLQIDHPERLLGTVLVALGVVLMVRGISRFTLLHGRRRFLLMVIIGFALGFAFREVLTTDIAASNPQFRVVGTIVPGLLASAMDRQGVVATSAMLVVSAVVVRLLVITFFASGPGF